MNLLIFGGTKFVGRHITTGALERGHRVTLFNRGKTNADLFPEAEKISGDRDGGLDALRGRTWDAVIDVNGYLPRLVNASAQMFQGAAAHYVYISTLSVYADFSRDGQTEDAPLATIQDPTVEVIDEETYGALKALCERAVSEHFPNRATMLRLGYVVGPHDHTDRWTYWVRRASQGGEMLVPGTSGLPVQFIDARDVAAFALHVTEQNITGIFNTCGPASPITWDDVYAEAKRARAADTTFTFVDENFLTEQNLEPGALPMFATQSERGIFTFDNSRGIAHGLQFHPLAETVRDTLEWDAQHGTPRAGLTPEQEQALLQKWHAHQNKS